MGRVSEKKWGGKGTPGLEFEERQRRPGSGYSLWPDQVKTITEFITVAEQFLETCPFELVDEVGLSHEVTRAIWNQKAIVLFHCDFPSDAEDISLNHEYGLYEFLFLLESMDMVMDMLDDARAYSLDALGEDAYWACKSAYWLGLELLRIIYT